MNITDEAVEAAAAANFGSKRGWADAGDAYKAAARAQARRMLEAAAPYMLARAWNEGYDYHRGITPDGLTGNPYRSQA